MKTFLVAVFCVLNVACATKTEYVPVMPPEPPRVERPEIESVNVQADDSYGTIIQAFRIDIKRLQKWGLELEALLDGYRKKEK